MSEACCLKAILELLQSNCVILLLSKKDTFLHRKCNQLADCMKDSQQKIELKKKKELKRKGPNANIESSAEQKNQTGVYEMRF